MVTFNIDGKPVKAEEGTSVFEAARGAGIEIPYFCYHPDMEPYGGCRLCMVEITENGMTRLHPSCAYPVKERIEVRTQTPRLKRGRKVIAELLLARCPNVDSVKNLAESLGVTKTRFAEGNSDCVLCGQCVRVCRNVVKAGAIDFTGRGINRRPGTPFDLPSEECIGCGSCAYVCPTGAMKMEYENVLRWRKLPGPLRKCRYMRMGFISHKVCPNNYECWNCEVDQRMEDLARTHPIFVVKHARESEKEKVDHFEVLFDRLYGPGHVWVKRLNGLVRLGIDDFTRQIVGRITDIKIPDPNTLVKPSDPLWLISAQDKALHMYAPLEGKIIDVNPDILDNPSLIGMDPYGRGWILSLEPKDILFASRKLLSGRSAKEWLKQETRRLYEVVRKRSSIGLSAEMPIPRDFSRKIGKEVWNRIDRAFFVQKEKKVRLHGVEDIYSSLRKGPIHP